MSELSCHTPTNNLEVNMQTTQALSQQDTQPLLQESHEDSADMDVDRDVWGILVPFSNSETRINFKTPRLSLGRHATNEVILTAATISRYHCSIIWDWSDSCEPIITVADLSRHGTYINGKKIGKGRHGILQDGAEVAFGERVTGNQYLFRLLTCKNASSTGLRSEYEILNEVGRGGYAVVLKGFGKRDGKIYAIKVVDCGRMIQSGGKFQSASTLEEAFILEKLSHPNVCSLIEAFYEDTRTSLVLEWVPGGDLLNYMDSHGVISEPKARGITFQICDAMAYVHSKGITHRDLKPENILLSTNDRSVEPTVKIADFGLSKAISSSGLQSFCGTAVYMAPEVWGQQDQKFDQGYQDVVDCWSLGVMVFFMLTYRTEHASKWYLLKQLGVSDTAGRFIRELLQECPKRRMTMANALNHAWLRKLNPGLSEAYVPDAENEKVGNSNTKG